MVMQGVITCSEVAKRLDKDKETIRKWCREKRLPAFKIGKDWLIREEDLQLVVQGR